LWCSIKKMNESVRDTRSIREVIGRHTQVH
jgi:hypothetical protein